MRLVQHRQKPHVFVSYAHVFLHSFFKCTKENAQELLSFSVATHYWQIIQLKDRHIVDRHALFPTGTKWEEISAVPRGEEEDFTE